MSEERTQTRSGPSARSGERDRSTASAPYQFDPDARDQLPTLFAGN